MGIRAPFHLQQFFERVDPQPELMAIRRHSAPEEVPLRMRWIELSQYTHVSINEVAGYRTERPLMGRNPPVSSSKQKHEAYPAISGSTNCIAIHHCPSLPLATVCRCRREGGRVRWCGRASMRSGEGDCDHIAEMVCRSKESDAR